MNQRKIHLLVFSLVMICSEMFSQSIDNELITEINQVTVHLKGAEIIREKEMTVNSGRSVLAFTGLSPKLNPKSVQITASNDVQILSVSSKVNYLKNGEKSPEIGRLNDSLTLMKIEFQNLEDEKQAFEEEKNLLKSNKNVRVKEEFAWVDELTKAADFYRSRFKEINGNISRIERAKLENNNEQKRLHKQLNELNAGTKPTFEIYVSVNSKTTVSSKFKLRYIVDNAGWSPIYDLVAADLNEDISLKYRALAFNDTGTDWENVKIKLSTADPYQGAGKPNLKPWVLRLGADVNQLIGVLDRPNQKYGEERNEVNEYLQSQNFMIADENALADRLHGGVEFQTIEISELNTDFDIEEPYNIPSDSKPYSIDISEFSLPAAYKHFAVPKLDKDAFLLAQITGWEDLDLISGPMNVYQGETYVGLANLNSSTISDTLELSLGRDQKVTLKREKRKEFTKKRFLGDKKLSSFSYRISVKNNHSTPVNIEILDQIPISNNKEISIDLKESSSALHIIESGKLTWEITLNSGGTKALNFSYNVKHPKDRAVNLFRSRKIMTPRYFE